MAYHPFEITARDGYTLCATRYEVADMRPTSSQHVLIAGATGVPQRFYRRFATWLAEQGYEVTTFDFRGIGESKYKPLRGFDANYLTWADQDLAGVVDALDQEFGSQRPIAMIGHSFGGHAYGMLPNVERTQGMYAFGAGAGWPGWMPKHEAIRVQALWKVIAPVASGVLGYLPMSKFGMGEDLPLGVYKQWRHWCTFPHYFFDDPEFKEEMHQRFDRVTQPVVFANATDDLWAMPRSAQAFLDGYREAKTKLQVIEAGGLDKGVGHMGYMRPGASDLWNGVEKWLQSL